VIRHRLLPLCHVATPNIEEAEVLAGVSPVVSIGSDGWDATLPKLRHLAERFHVRGCPALVITGGHLHQANDYLSSRSGAETVERVFAGTHIESRSTHGTGCAFASALACGLAKGGGLAEAVQGAKDFVRKAITAAYPVGDGRGPMNHLFRLDQKS
jgi:hydroxymethylpyrimidine/phosphomethylpyrimidine kinase